MTPLLLIALAAGGCATPSRARQERPGATIDFVDAVGTGSTVDAFRGKVVVIDVCASWAAACNLNAKVLDEVQTALAGKPVFILTILVDDRALAEAALASYQNVLEVKHAVVLAGPRLRAGTGVLGDAAAYVPRLVVLDKEGAVRVDDSGGVLNVEGLLAKVKPLL